MALSEFIKLFQHFDFIGIFIEITLKKYFYAAVSFSLSGSADLSISISLCGDTLFLP